MLTPATIAGCALALGLVVGSFLNVVIYRLPRGESIVFPHSRCPACQRPLGPLENVPVFSYLFLRGRCRGCGVRISSRYPLVEGLTGIVFLAIVLRFGVDPMTALWLVFAAGLIAAALIDFDHRIIPDSISVGGLVLGLVALPVLAHVRGGDALAELQRAGLGAALGGGMLWVVGFLHARVSVAAGRRFEHWPGRGEALPHARQLDYWIWFPGLGFGDVKLLAAIGAFVGPVGVVETILASSLIGLVMGGVWMLVTRRLDAPFGFGPAIALGALVVLLSPIHVASVGF